MYITMLYFKSCGGKLSEFNENKTGFLCFKDIKNNSDSRQLKKCTFNTLVQIE